MTRSLCAWPVVGIAEVEAGDDLVGLILEAAGDVLVQGDILVVSSKIVSKAEGRIVPARDRESAITAETVRVVATRIHAGGLTRIVETRQGLVCAAAGVDASNVPDGTVLLLPVNPDRSARNLAAGVRDALGVDVGVIISDTFGRPWRAGQVDVAIGAAGVTTIRDLRGTTDSFGRTLDVTMSCVADEAAAAAELVKGKASGLPVVIVRGLATLVGPLDDRGADAIIRPPADDMFAMGTSEAYELGYQDALRASARRSDLSCTEGNHT